MINHPALYKRFFQWLLKRDSLGLSCAIVGNKLISTSHHNIFLYIHRPIRISSTFRVMNFPRHGYEYAVELSCYLPIRLVVAIRAIAASRELWL